MYLFKDTKIVFYPTECNMSLCDAIIPTCKPSEKLVVGYHPLSCCPQYRCGKGNTKPQLVASFPYFYFMLEKNSHSKLSWLLTEWDTVNNTRQLCMFFKIFSNIFLCLCFVLFLINLGYFILLSIWRIYFLYLFCIVSMTPFKIAFVSYRMWSFSLF